ncbi:MAG: response regulator [Firmicutes bacterium]|nr:response regulator [Bacillota bacterium]
MKELLGLYIEDDVNNVMVQQARFDLFEGISIKGLDELPEKVEDFYPVIVRDHIDFLIIDHELDKQTVSYKGCDALNEIRKYDSTIYAILLTNYPLADYKEELGAYDYQLTKSEMKEPGKLEEVVQKIKRACELRRDNKLLAEMEQRQKEKEELIRELKSLAAGKKG